MHISGSPWKKVLRVSRGLWREAELESALDMPFLPLPCFSVQHDPSPSPTSRLSSYSDMHFRLLAGAAL